MADVRKRPASNNMPPTPDPSSSATRSRPELEPASATPIHLREAQRSPEGDANLHLAFFVGRAVRVTSRHPWLASPVRTSVCGRSAGSTRHLVALKNCRPHPRPAPASQAREPDSPFGLSAGRPSSPLLRPVARRPGVIANWRESAPPR